MNVVVEILKKARETLSDKSRWTKGAGARDAQNNPTFFDSDDAACFCSLGAIANATVSLQGYNEATYALSFEILERTGKGSIPNFNDAPETTHADVLSAFDGAIARAEREVP